MIAITVKVLDGIFPVVGNVYRFSQFPMCVLVIVVVTCIHCGRKTMRIDFGENYL